MPVHNGVGYGPHTETKMQHLHDIMSWHIGVTQAVMNQNGHFRPGYHYIDATAGPGICPELGLKGSPLVFLELAESSNLPCFCDFIELLQCNCESLRSNLPETTKEIRIIHGDYAQLLPKLIMYDRLQLGLIFVDPSGQKPYFNTLARISKRRPAMELLFYLSATTLKRTYHIHEKRLSDYIQTLNKRYWLVREPISDDPHQFTFLLGSNSKVFAKDYKKIGLFRLNSEDAQRFFPRLNFNRFTVKKKKGRFQQMDNNLFKLVSSGKAPPADFFVSGITSKWDSWRQELAGIPFDKWHEYEFPTGRESRLAHTAARNYSMRVVNMQNGNAFTFEMKRERVDEEEGPARLFVLKQKVSEE